MGAGNRGRVIGRAGAGLDNASWAANAGVARAGQIGEVATAELLDELARDGMVVLHDLMIPIPGITANIDHAVVAGRKVLLIDTKRWAPGFFWTVSGCTRRGFERFPAADKQTMAMARDSIVRYLNDHHVARPKVLRPIVAVWPSNESRSMRLWFLRVPGAQVLHASRLVPTVRHLLPPKPADERIVEALAELVTDQTSAGGGNLVDWYDDPFTDGQNPGFETIHVPFEPDPQTHRAFEPIVAREHPPFPLPTVPNTPTDLL